MQLRLERNTLHMYTAGTSMSEKERAIGGWGGRCLIHATQKYEFNLQCGDSFGTCGHWLEVCLRVRTR